MAKPPLTRETAQVGQSFQDAIGNTYQKVLSPYANDGKTTMDVLQPARHAIISNTGPAGIPGRRAPSPIADVAIPAAAQASQPPTQVEEAASVPEIADPTAQAQPPAPVNLNVPQVDLTAPHADQDLTADHLADLQDRQDQADKNDQAEAELHDQIANTTAASAADPVPTIAPQPIQAGMVPTGALQDIGRGAIEAPDMVMSGAKSAVRNLIAFSDHLSDLVDEHIPLDVAWDQTGMTFGNDAKAMEASDKMPDSRPLAQFDREFPQTPNDQPHSVTGGMIKGVSQFATGMAGGGSLLKGWKVATAGAKLAKSFAEGALSDFGAFDAHQDRLSNMLKDHAPKAVAPLFDYLAADPRDGEVEGRFKNALEGLGLGGAAHGIMAAARALRAARMAQRAAQIAAQNEGLQGIIDAPQKAVVDEANAFHSELGAAVGDPNAAGFTIKRKFPLTAEEVAANAGHSATAPVAAGKVRLYHGGNPTGNGSLWFSTSYDYAHDYHGGPNPVWYVDAPEGVLYPNAAAGETAAAGFAPLSNLNLPGELASQRQLFRTGDSGAQMGPNTIGLNYAKIADADDMQAAAVQFYDAFHPEITDAKRGVQSINKQVTDAFGVNVAKLLGEWSPGQAMASHELSALRFAQAGAMADFLRQARAIAAGDGSLAAQAAFLQTGGVLDAMTRAVEGGKSEAARTLRTLRETVPSMKGEVSNPADAIEFYRKVDALVAGAGGREMVQNAAKAFLTVAQANPIGTSRFLRGIAWLGKFNDGSKEVLRVFTTNGLLTAGGITANVFGNTSALVWERMMRQLAPKLSGMVGAPSYIADREAIESQTAALSAFGDVFRLKDHINAGWNPIAQGKTLSRNFDDAKLNTKGFASAHREEVSASTKPRNIGQAGLEKGPGWDTALGRVASFVYAASKIPGQTHGVLDDFSNIISGRAELASQAYRQAVKDSETGIITPDQVGVQMQKYMEDPDANMLQRTIAAQQNTSWTRKPDTSMAAVTNGLKSMRTGLDNLPVPLPLGTSVFPFINTPANLFSYGIQNSIFAPISSRFRADLMSADGATRQLALTKYAAGSMMSLWIMNHVANGTMTGGGPHDPAERQAMMRIDPDTGRTIFQPYSARIGDNWVSMNRLDPFSTNFALAADMSEAWLGNDWTDARIQTATDAFSSVSMAFGNAFLGKSTMQGASQLMDALADAKTGNLGKADKFVEARAAALVPFSAADMTARKMVDPYQREVRGVVDQFKNMTPGLSSTLPKSFDLWGRARTYESGMGTAYDNVIPARTLPVGGEAADREMLRLGFGKTMPSTTIHTQAGPADLKNYPTIANEILTRGGPPALQELNDLVTGGSPNSDYYNTLSDGSDVNAPGSKARYLKGRLDFHFNQATQSVKRDFADDLSSIAAEQATRRAAARTGP